MPAIVGSIVGAVVYPEARCQSKNRIGVPAVARLHDRLEGVDYALFALDHPPIVILPAVEDQSADLLVAWLAVPPINLAVS
jgi:hypothetical protein